MPSTLSVRLLCAAMLAALPLRALAAPAELAPTDGPAAGDTSGEEEEQRGERVTPDQLSTSEIWAPLIGATQQHRAQFEEEFQGAVDYHSLDHYKVSLPAKCPSSNFSMEACLRRLAEGLQTYAVLFKHVAREYPGSPILSEARHFSGLLISQIKAKMRSPEQVRPLTSSQQEQLLRAVASPDAFRRKMAAHGVLRQLHDFLRDAKAAVSKRERSRARAFGRVTSPQQQPPASRTKYY